MDMTTLYNAYLGTDDGAEPMTERCKRHDGYQKAYDSFVQRKLSSILTMEYNLGKLGPDMKRVKEYEDRLKAENKEQVAEDHNNRYMFITINPKESVNFGDFRKKLEKLIHRQIFTNHMYVYEQRGKNTDEAGKGFHAHILVERNLSYKPSKTKELIQNTMKDVVGSVKSPALLNLQFVGKDFILDKVEYMKADKTGEGKDLKQEIDLVWRSQMELEQFYETEGFGDELFSKYMNIEDGEGNESD